MNMNKTKFVLPMVALGVAFLLSCSSSMDEVAKAQCTVTQGEWNEATKQCESCPPGTSKYDGQCVASAIQLANGQYACPTGTTLNANNMCVAGIIAVDPNTTPQTTKYYCDYGQPYIEDREVFGDCWRIGNQTDRDNCSKWGKEVDACPTYSCPAGTARPAPGWACEIGAVPAEKYCYYGKATECWPITVYDTYVKTESDCEAHYGIVVTSCSGVVVTYCDWGQPYIEDGKAQGGCWSIKNATEERNCPSNKKVNSCPNYSCPNGTTKITNSWGDSGCELSGSTPTPSGKSCYWPTGCWPINSDTELASCIEDSGKVVSDCASPGIEYCDYGQPVIKADGSVDNGCFVIVTKTANECMGTKRSSCPATYTCPSGTTQADYGWGDFWCR